MDWFRRQRRAKKVAPGEDAHALPPPASDIPASDTPAPDLEAPLETDPPVSPLEFPQPFQVELTNPPAPAPPPPGIPQPLEVRILPSATASAPPDLSLHQFMLAEFGYITQTSFQSTEDRARVTQFYFVASTAVIGAILGVRLEGTPTPWFYLAFSLIFIVLIILGWLTILQLAQLRAAWLTSVAAMNQIKQYYLDHADDAARRAFLWTNATRPPALKRRSVAYLLFVSVVVVNFGLTLALAAFLSLMRDANALTNGNMVNGLIMGALVAIILVYFQHRTYKGFVGAD